MFGDARYLDGARRCADAVWTRGLLRKGYGLCHGTAGNAYAALALFNATGEQKFLYRAWKVCSARLDDLQGRGCVCVGGGRRKNPNGSAQMART